MEHVGKNLSNKWTTSYLNWMKIYKQEGDDQKNINNHQQSQRGNIYNPYDEQQTSSKGKNENSY